MPLCQVTEGKMQTNVCEERTLFALDVKLWPRRLERGRITRVAFDLRLWWDNHTADILQGGFAWRRGNDWKISLPPYRLAVQDGRCMYLKTWQPTDVYERIHTEVLLQLARIGER